MRSPDAHVEPSRPDGPGCGCPSEADHRAFLLGDLPEDQADAIAEHIETCPKCEERSQRIDGVADPVVAALREPAALASTIDGWARHASTESSVTPPGPRYVAGYELIEEVGRGGMGVVYKARQIRLNRTVALKMILSGPFARPEELVRFHVEGETLARLTHPSIVRIYEIGQADGRPYFTMEWVDGGNLADRLAAGPVPPSAAAALVEQIARAVHYAHENGVVHRDLKPANILLATGGSDSASREQAPTVPFPAPPVSGQFTPKVTDFGLAKPIRGECDLTATGMVIGTPGYMAPEQARGDRFVGPTADVYSLGAILYELLTGRPPFPLPGTADPSRVTPAAIIGQVIDRDPLPPRRLIPALPRDLATICLRSLEKAPGSRYQTARDLADDLRRFLNGEAVRARRSGELERVWKWAKRRPVVAGLLAAVAASLVLGAAVSTYFAVEARRQADGASFAQRQAEENERAAGAARVDAVQARNNSQRQLARADFQEGRRLAELGRVGEGMHWMVSALRHIPDETADQPFREVVRRNLGGWSGRLHRLRHLIACPDDIYALAFSPNGRLFATGGHDRTVRLYRADTGEPAGAPLAAGARVRVIAFSPDGRYLAAGGDVGYQQGERARVCRWEVATGRELPPTDVPDDVAVTSITFSRESDTVFVGGLHIVPRGVAGVWTCRTDTGTRVAFLRAPTGSPQCKLAARAAGPGFVATAWNDAPPVVWVAAFDGTTATPWVRIATPTAPFGMGFHAADRLVVTDPTGTRAYEIPSGTPVPDRSRYTGPSWVAESPDGRFRVAGAAPGALRLWDATSGAVQALIGLDETHQALTFSPNGRQLVAACRGGTVRVWDLAPPCSPPPAKGEGEAPGPPGRKRLTFVEAAFSRDRSAAVFAGGDGAEIARVWRADPAAPGRDLPQSGTLFTKRGHQISLTPDGGRVVALDTGRSLRVWDARTGRPVGPVLAHSNGVSAQALDPTGSVLASGDYAMNVHLRDVATGRSLGVLRQTDIVFAIEFSADGKLLAVSTWNDWKRTYGVRVWNVASQTQIGELIDTGGPTPAWLVFSPDSAVLLTAAGDGVRRWDARTGKAIGGLIPHAGGATAVTFHPDGRHFLTGGGAGHLRLWDAKTGEAVGVTMTASTRVTGLEFHPDGRLVAAGYADGTARVWDTVTGQPIGPPVVQPGPLLAATFPPGRQILRTAAADGSVRDWPLAAALAGTPDELEREMSAASGLRMDAGKVVTTLDAAAWGQIRRQPPSLLPDRDWHAAHATDAEQASDAVAARWHLDRLIVLDPNDWRLWARRGRAAVDDGRLADADADYAKATRLASAGAVAIWYQQRAADCRGAERWDAARWYLDRLIAAEPGEWRHYAARSGVFARLERTALAEADRDEAARLGADSRFLVRLAQDRARQGRWGEAADLFERAGRDYPDALQYAAMAYLKSGDRAAYHRQCARLLDALGPSLSHSKANNVAAVCAMGPAGVDDYARPLVRIDHALAALVEMPDGADRNSLRHDYLNTQGSLFVRAGRYQAGIDRLNDAMRAAGGDGTVHDWIFLAIASHHLNRPDEATAWLARARRWKPATATSGFWAHVEVEVILAEAEALLDRR
jgi:eukaryotic-like serine/threonine-protein kinase